jgi:hypothetical protein
MMSSNTPSRPTPNSADPGSAASKSGLADRMRTWMKSRTGTKTQRRFSVDQLCKALCVTAGEEHQKIANALYDFEQRGELVGYLSQKHKRRQYLYVQDWKRVLRGHLNRKIFKAMYVANTFAVTDIQRLTGVQERDYLDKLVRQLKKDGYLQPIQRRRCAHGAGAENIYHIVHRDKFKLEVMR